jgi:hypothetical protein
MKVSVEKVVTEKYAVEYPLEEIRELLHFKHNSTTMRVPYNAILNYRGASPETGGPVLIATFELEIDLPSPSGLTQNEVDVWGLIRKAGEEGITYQRMELIMDGAMSIQVIGKVVRSLVDRRLVEECPEKQHAPGRPPRKLWRSVE